MIDSSSNFTVLFAVSRAALYNPANSNSAVLAGQTNVPETRPEKDTLDILLLLRGLFT